MYIRKCQANINDISFHIVLLTGVANVLMVRFRRTQIALRRKSDNEVRTCYAVETGDGYGTTTGKLNTSESAAAAMGSRLLWLEAVAPPGSVVRREKVLAFYPWGR